MSETEHQESTHKEQAKGRSGSSDSFSPTLEPDQVVGGRYRILEQIGKGGMGIVYKVEQVYVGKKFALKTIDRRHLSDVTARRFQHEARATFAVDHPNIVSVHDYGLLDDQTPFLAMELVTGHTLSSQLATRSLTVDEAIPIFVQVCFGLAHAHKSGVVHRDIKPSNIMLIDGATPGTEGSVKILDFGIAKFTHHEHGEIQALTKTGEIFGSPLYMSPEQCMGTRVDHRSDVYSLGCVLYEALTGTPPYAGENALATMMMHNSEPLLSLKEASLGKEYPAEIEKIVQTMLAKKPEDRYQNLGLAANDLAAVARGAIGDVSVLNTSQDTASADKSGKMVTVSQSQLIFQMVVISILSALVSAAITHFVQNNSTSSADADGLSKEKVSDDAVRKVGKQPDHPQIAKMIQIDSGQEREYATAEETLKMAKKDVERGRTDVRLVGGTIDKTVLQYLASQKQIKNLNLMNAQLDNHNLGILGSLPELWRMSLLNSTLDDVGIEQLRRCKHLTHIKMGRTLFTNAGLSTLSKFSNLKNVNIECCRQVTFLGVSLLCASKTIEKMKLNECPNLTPADQKALKKMFKRIEFEFSNESTGTD